MKKNKSNRLGRKSRQKKNPASAFVGALQGSYIVIAPNGASVLIQELSQAEADALDLSEWTSFGSSL